MLTQRSLKSLRSELTNTWSSPITSLLSLLIIRHLVLAYGIHNMVFLLHQRVVERIKGDR